LALWVYSGPMVENLLTKVYLDPGVYRGPPEVYRGPCMKIMRWNTQLAFTDVLDIFQLMLLNSSAPGRRGNSKGWTCGDCAAVGLGRKTVLAVHASIGLFIGADPVRVWGSGPQKNLVVWVFCGSDPAKISLK